MPASREPAGGRHGQPRRAATSIVLVATAHVALLLLLYTGYDKQAQRLSIAQLASVLSFGDATWSLEELNKVCALSGIGLVALALVLGPLHRLFPKRFARTLQLRKAIGVTGFAFGAAHAACSVTVSRALSEGVSRLDHPTCFAGACGVLALFILAVMSATSGRAAITRIGRARWRAIHGFGPVALLLAIVHFVFIETDPVSGLHVRPYGLVWLAGPIAALGIRLAACVLAIERRRRRSPDLRSATAPAHPRLRSPAR